MERERKKICRVERVPARIGSPSSFAKLVFMHARAGAETFRLPPNVSAQQKIFGCREIEGSHGNVSVLPEKRKAQRRCLGK